MILKLHLASTGEAIYIKTLKVVAIMPPTEQYPDPPANAKAAVLLDGSPSYWVSESVETVVAMMCDEVIDRLPW